MLTQKHFKAVAGIINDETYVIGINQTIESIACELADYFATQNSRFDREQFLAACGLEGGK